MSTLLNFIAGNWEASRSTETRPVYNPASAEPLAAVALSTAEETAAAVVAAHRAFPAWSRIPLTERVQFLFRLKARLEEDFEELSKTITLECGKTLAESRGEMRRAVENVEVACAATVLMQGQFSEDIAPGIDEFLIRQPLGVCAIIAPFNFPGMIPFWFLPYALVAGNTVVLKPSERVPLTMAHVFRILAELGLPPGVVNLVNGGREAVDTLLDDPRVQAVSFVGSSATARYVYGRAAANGKRVQCQGGAKNPIVIAADAHLESTTQVVADSAFGCAGQRCLAASMAVLVGEARGPFRESLRHAAASRTTGFGLDAVQMGPVISAESRDRIGGLVAAAERDGARVSVDGRAPKIPHYEKGYFVRPTILEDLPLTSAVARTEIFGPVLSLHEANDLDEALAIINSGEYGNMACLFTASGDLARRFRSEAEVGNVGINVGVAAPMAFFPFSGARGSFFGDLHGQGRDAFQFFTRQKVVVERWPRAVSRLF
ncbi:MAG TPA: CoA-acylating methylmalonate-semialdehyde dehydrogenase [Bryobacteraceae bacterium]|nr:CoA-acylating methylmalonate-semialdehyde dehydrogenase [Bryobacteraceae bacterium]